MSRVLLGFVLDTLEFVREARSVSGQVPVAALPRLVEALGEGVVLQEELQCTLAGRQGIDGRWLRLQVQGNLPLICQRCLGSMPYGLELDVELKVIAPGEVWPEEVEEDGAILLEVDAIAANPALVLTELIEDEVLLALPIAPRHEDCVPPVRNDDEQAASPFAMLAQLKKH